MFRHFGNQLIAIITIQINHYDLISMIQASSCQQESIVSVLSDAPIEE